MADSVTREHRSAVMASVKSKGNRSTEGKVEATLRETRIRGWIKHPDTVDGCPDFYFPRDKLAVFVDGCFWHACPRCGRLPSSNVKYWTGKIDSNRRRDNRVRRQLRARGVRVLRIWEHELKGSSWLRRLQRMISR